MKDEIRIIWQEAINLGFQFNESDAHDIWIAIKDKQNSNSVKDRDLIQKACISSGLISVTNSQISIISKSKYISKKELLPVIARQSKYIEKLRKILFNK